MNEIVYAFYDGTEIVYIGCTGDIAKRLKNHRSASPWWTPELRLEVLSVYDGHLKACKAENLLIREHQPIHNVQGNPRYAKRVTR